MNPFQSVGTKLFFYIFGGILACVLTMGIMAYNQSKSIIENKVSESGQQTISQLAVNLNNTLKKYDDLTLQVMVDPAFHELVGTVTDKQRSEERRVGKSVDRGE